MKLRQILKKKDLSDIDNKFHIGQRVQIISGGNLNDFYPYARSDDDYQFIIDQVILNPISLEISYKLCNNTKSFSFIENGWVFKEENLCDYDTFMELQENMKIEWLKRYSYHITNVCFSDKTELFVIIFRDYKNNDITNCFWFEDIYDAIESSEVLFNVLCGMTYELEEIRSELTEQDTKNITNKIDVKDFSGCLDNYTCAKIYTEQMQNLWEQLHLLFREIENVSLVTHNFFKNFTSDHTQLPDQLLIFVS
jgi:hypothetical protein